MNTYEPTPTRQIKQSLSEELLKFIARMTSTKRNTKKVNDIAEVPDIAEAPDNTMYTRLESLFQKLYTVTYKKINTSDYAWVISPIFTKLGERVVFMQLYCKYKKVTLIYFDSKDAESFSNDTPIFSLKVTPKRLILRPFNTPLSSHDIDMAIYEIEQIVEKEYRVVMNEFNKHDFNEHDLNEHDFNEHDLNEHHKKETQLFYNNTK